MNILFLVFAPFLSFWVHLYLLIGGGKDTLHHFIN
jgi:hypothetical protein